jgi:hypothetical protein
MCQNKKVQSEIGWPIGHADIPNGNGPPWSLRDRLPAPLAVVLFFRLQSESPENGSICHCGWRLSRILSPKSSTISLWRLKARRKTRVWRAFLITERKFSENETAWLGREDSNPEMAKWKSEALACPPEAAEPLSVEIDK